MLDLLLAALWSLGGLIGALPDGRFEWVAGPLAAAGWGITAGKAGLRQLLVARRPVSYMLLGGVWLAASGMLMAAGTSPKDAVLPACAVAVALLYLLERRSAVQSHAMIAASFVAAVIGATRDPSARMLPLFVPFLVLLVLCLALAHQEWVLQRLRRAAHEGYLLAAQVPGYAGTRTGLAPTVSVVAMTTTVAALVLYLVVPHVRWKQPDDRRGTGGSGSQGASGLTDRLSLRGMHELKLDHRVALRMKLARGGANFRPSLPMRLRGTVVDATNGTEWWSTASWRTRRDENDGKKDNWVTLMADPADPVMQECEIEATGDTAIVSLPEVAEVAGATASVDDHGAVRLPSPATGGRRVYRVISDAAGTDPRTFEAQPRSPHPRYLMLPRGKDPDILQVARDVAGNAATAVRKAALIEHWLQANFEYSTEFDPSGESDPVRALLFSEKRGYCVHFAAAMAVMLRCLDIPCRVAQGLYGGEWSDREQLSMFRFSDAHAWVEVWLGPRAGWVPFDPTPRTQDDAGEDPSEFARNAPDPSSPEPQRREASRTSSPFSTEPLTSLNLERQAQWLRALRRLFLDAWDSRLGKAVVLFAVFSFSLVLTWHLLPRHERNRLRAALTGAPAADAAFWDEFVTLAGRAGFRRGRGETPFEFAKRVERSYPGAGRVALALYAVRFGGRDAAEKSAEARPVLDGIRKAQAGKAPPAETPQA